MCVCVSFIGLFIRVLITAYITRGGIKQYTLTVVHFPSDHYKGIPVL